MIITTNILNNKCLNNDKHKYLNKPAYLLYLDFYLLVQFNVPTSFTYSPTLILEQYSLIATLGITTLLRKES